MCVLPDGLRDVDHVVVVVITGGGHRGLNPGEPRYNGVSTGQIRDAEHEVGLGKVHCKLVPI